MSAPVLCRGCGKSDGVLTVDALAATTTVALAGQVVPLTEQWMGLARNGEVPVRVVVVICTHCDRVLGKPAFQRASIKDTGGQPPQRAR
jgi:hypothetical protein